MALAVLAYGSAAPSVQATDGTWNIDAAGNWSTASNWLSSTIADGQSSTANLTFNITGNRTITIDTTSRTLGILNIGDSNTTHTYTLAASGGASLIFDNAGSAAQLNQVSTSNGATISAPLLLNDSLDISNAAASGKTLTLSGTIAANSAGTKTLTNKGSGAGSVTISGVIGDGSGGGTVAVVQNSSTSALTLSNANTFTGGLTVSAGSLTLSNTAAAGASANTITLGGGASNVTLTSSVTLTNYNINVLSGAGTVTLSGTFTGSNTITLNGGQGLTVNNGNLQQMTRKIVESGGVSAVTLNANAAAFNVGQFGNTANAFSGGLTVNGTGQISFATGGTGSFAGTGPLTINSAVIFNQQSASATVTGLSKLVLNSDFTINGGSTGIGLVFNTAPVDLGATGSAATRTITVGSVLTLGGVISDGTNGTTKNLAKNGTGTLTLNGANTFTGSTTANNGTLTVGATGKLGAGDFAVNNTNTGAGNNTIVNLNSAQTVGSLSGTIATPSSGTNTATVNLTGASTILTVKQASNSSYAGVLAGTGGLKLDSTSTGQLTLTGVNTYTGATTVGGGTLLVSGSGTLNSTSGISITGGTFNYANSTTGLNRNVTVNGGTFKNNGANYTGTLTFTSGTLGGTNLAGVNLTGGNAIGSGKTLSPGNSPGDLATGNQEWLDGGAFQFEINDAAGVEITNWDHTTITGSLDLDALSAGGFTLQLVSLDALNAAGLAQNFNSANSYVWEFASFDSLIGTFNSNLFAVNTSGFQNSFSGTFSVVQIDANSLGLQYTAVPEPSTYALFGIGLGALWMLRRKKCKKSL
jgi:autotransporter-associated beta strand protein